MADIRYVVSVDTKTAQASIREFTGDIQKSAGQIKQTGEIATEAGGKFSGLWKQFALGQIAVNAINKAFHEVTEIIGKSIRAAAEAEAADRALEAALATTGRTVEPLKTHFINLAESIQRETVYSNEAAKSATTLLLQLTSLDREGITQATRAATGLASTLKIDLQSAAMLVAKAMEGNIGALSRYGIRVGENLSLEEKRRQLLAQLLPLYDRAKSETDTFSGAQLQLKNSLDDLLKTIGFSITKNESFRNAIKDLKDWVDKLAASEDFKLWLSALVEGFEKVAKAAGTAAKAIAGVGTWIGERAVLGLKGGKKANEEYEESVKRLKEALERAKAAGHDFEKKFHDLAEAHKKGQEAINETGKKIKEETDLFKKEEEKVKTKVLAINQLIPAQRQLLDVISQAPSAFRDEIYGFEIAAEAARNFSEVISNLPTVVEDAPYAYERATSDIRNYFDGLYNDIASGLGNLIQKWLEGGLTLKNFMKGVWDEIKHAFFRMLGEMIATELIKKLKDILSGALDIGKSLSSTISTVAKTATSVVSNVGTALSGFSSLATMLGGLGGLANFASSIFNFLKGPEKQTDITFWLKLIKDNSQIIVNYLSADYLALIKGIFEKLEAINDQALSYQNRLLEDISNYTAGIKEAAYGVWDALKGIKKAQFGFDGIVSRPTLFMAGEAGPERVIVQPVSGGNTVSQSFVFNIYSSESNITEAIKKKILPELSRLMRSESFLIHPRAVRSY